MIDAYPLSWPVGWQRTPNHERKSPRFMKKENVRSRIDPNAWTSATRYINVSDGVDRVLDELRMLGVERRTVIISTNVELRRDGVPRSDRANVGDPGVAVYWTDPHTGQQDCMAVDLYDTVAGNLGAVAATLDAMRAIERHGGAQILKRAFQGFKALPGAGGSTPTMDVQTASVVLSNYYPTLTPEIVRSDRAALETAVRFARARVHPDVTGGDTKAWDNVETARKVLEAHHGQKR
jgi:hypothetical protein